MVIDTKWFQSRLAERDLSQRALAKLMGLDPAAVSLLLRGKRKITMAEAAQLAALLDVPPSDMLERFGITPPGASRVKLVGFVNGQSEVQFSPKGTHSLVDPPGLCPPETIAVQVRTAGTALERMDGQLWFIDHTKTNPAQHINSWCIVARKDGKAMVCMIRRGYQRGTYNLTGLGGKVEENQEVAWSSPVIWAKFAA